ncbi:MAG: glycerol-3-phosphate responsive antiterminator [Burkholderiaceae bacterium]
MDVVLADGSLITVGGYSRAAIGPDLQQLFIGSEGTLGVIVRVRLKLRRLPDYGRAIAYGVDTFAIGLDACREIMQRAAIRRRCGSTTHSRAACSSSCRTPTSSNLVQRMPAPMLAFITPAKRKLLPPIVASGFISNEADIRSALKNDAVAVSTSDRRSRALASMTSLTPGAAKRPA